MRINIKDIRDFAHYSELRHQGKVRLEELQNCIRATRLRISELNRENSKCSDLTERNRLSILLSEENLKKTALADEAKDVRDFLAEIKPLADELHRASLT